MSLSTDSWSSVSDSTTISENSDEGDSSSIYRMTNVVDNKVLITCPFCGLVLSLPLPLEVQEVDQEITSNSTGDSQPVESNQLESPSRTIEGRRLEDGNEGLDEKRKRSAERSALSKRKKVDP